MSKRATRKQFPYKLAAVCLAIAFVAGALFGVSLRSADAPEFSRGGVFSAIANDSPITRSPKRAAAAIPKPGRPAAPGTAVPRSVAPSTPRVLLPGKVSTPIALSSPVDGTYTYSVEGFEHVRGRGRRHYPETMTLVSKPGEKSTHVFDLTYSRGHEERQIVSVDDNGLALTYEASSVSFLSTVNTETEYAPALTVIPTLHTGAKRRGTSTAYNSDRSVSRVIDWNASVVGREVVRIADEDVEAWVVKVTRRSRLGTRDQEARTRIFWYDPARAIWVKWTESVKMSRRYRFGTYQYDSKLTATLQSFRD